MRAIILAAGRGTRLRPVTDWVPKPLIPFFGRPFLEYTLDEIHGLVTEVVLVVHYQADQVQQTLGSEYRGIPLRYVYQESLGGSGDALQAARDYLTERTLVILGDVLVERGMVEEMLAMEDEPAISVARIQDPENHLGVAVADGRARGVFVDSEWVDRGVFLLGPGFLDCAEETARPEGELRIMRMVQHLVGLGVPVGACCSATDWVQIGDHSGMEGILATMDWIGKRVGVSADSSVDADVGGAEVTRSIVFGPGRVADGRIEESLVYVRSESRGVDVHHEIRVLGNGNA